MRQSAARRSTGAVRVCLACAVAAAAPAPAVAELRQVVFLARHGVRTPLPTKPPMSVYAADPWPSDPGLAPGALTPRGAGLVRILGGYYRDRYRALLPGEGCPPSGAIGFRADAEERDLATARAFAEGLAPGCEPEIAHVAPERDPLFHPTRAGVCARDEAALEAAVLARIGSFAAADASFAEPLRRMQEILRCCRPEACEDAGIPAPCTLHDLPGGVSGKGWLRGAIGVASTATEDFLLQWADGRPEAEIGWGRVSRADLERLLPVHVFELEVAKRALPSARAEASNLAVAILASLRAGERAHGSSGGIAPVSGRLAFYVGHDVDLAGVGGLLGLHWEAGTFPPDATPPGSALVFELHGAGGGSSHVRAFFVTQTLDQMRSGVSLSPESPPSVFEIGIPGCSSGDRGCPLPGFARLVASVVDAECVSPELRGALASGEGGR